MVNALLLPPPLARLRNQGQTHQTTTFSPLQAILNILPPLLRHKVQRQALPKRR